MKPALVVRRGSVTAARCAAHSRALFAQRETDAEGTFELLILEPTTEAVVRGSFQSSGVSALARASGGSEMQLSPGVLFLSLRVPEPAAFAPPASVDTILNRAVRPLLRALTKSGATARYFGRDWVSAGGKPVALVAFAHEMATQRTVFEAAISVMTTALPRVRASYLGNSPITVAALSARPPELWRVADRLEEAYADALGLAREPRPLVETSDAPALERPLAWTVTREEPIGELGAARDADGNVRIGGELMVSSDGLARFEDALVAIDLRDSAAVKAAAERTFAEGAALFGVRDLASVVEVISGVV